MLLMTGFGLLVVRCKYGLSVNESLIIIGLLVFDGSVEYRFSGE